MKSKIRPIKITAILIVLMVVLLVPLFALVPERASASIIDQVELVDQRTRTSKTYWLGETPEGNQRFALDASIGSIHYQEGGQWLDIESDIVPSPKAGWSWEVVKGHWHLLIKDDTSIAVGKDGHWLGFRYEGFAYLDKSTNGYVILDNRRAVTPTVEGNKIRWEGIFHGVNLEYIYGNDRFKENLEITQAARDWCSANPPSSYGLNNQTTYLVGFIQCDWRYSYKAKDVDGNSINWTQPSEFQETPIHFWHPIKNYIVSALPVDYAYHQTDIEYEPLKLRKRFIRAPNDNYYLLFGAKVTNLNQFPNGTIVFDPTVDEQVDATGDDGHWHDNGAGGFNNTNHTDYAGYVNSYYYHSFQRFPGVTIEGTIDTSYLEFFGAVESGSPDLQVYGVDDDNPDAPTNYATAVALPETSASVQWQPSNGSYAWTQTTSINTVVQELVDTYTIDNEAIMFQVHETTSSGANYYKWRTFDLAGEGGAYAPKLHIEYTAGAGVSAPTVATYNATSVEETTATLVGNITATGGENPSHRGFYWDTDSGHPYANNDITSGNYSVGQFTYNASSLTEGELYYYIATANNSGGTGNGTEVTFLTKPDEPTSFSAGSMNSTMIPFTWANGDGRDNTLLYYREGGYPADPTSGNLSYNSTGTSHNVTGLSQATQYWFWLRSWCTEGGLEQYSDLTANVTDYTLPGDPSGMVAENVTATSIDVRWSGGTGGDYTMVRRDTGSYPADVSSGDQAYYNTGLDFSDSGLDKGTTYYYRAWARDTDSNYYSAGYTSANATTNTTAPTMTNASGATSITSNSATLNGNLSDDGGEQCTVIIYWGDNDGTDNVSLWDNSEDMGLRNTGTFSQGISSLNATTQYFYRCSGNNSQGTDWADSTSNFTTLAVGHLSAPSNFTATHIDDDDILLEWTPGTQAEYTFIVANYGRYPIDRTDGYIAYNGTGTSHNDRLVDLFFSDENIYYTAWSENTSQSFSGDVAHATVGGLMTDIVLQLVTLIAMCFIITLAVTRRDIFLYIIAFPAALTFGWYWYDAYQSPTHLIIGMAFSAIGVYCLVLAITNLIIAITNLRRKT